MADRNGIRCSFAACKSPANATVSLKSNEHLCPVTAGGRGAIKNKLSFQCVKRKE